MESSEIETAAESIDSSVIFHIINEIVGFLLYMHQQIPSNRVGFKRCLDKPKVPFLYPLSLTMLYHRTLQDITLEFDMLKSEYEELGVEITKTDLKPSTRRKHNSSRREIKQGIRRVEKLMNTVSSIRAALQLVVSKNPDTRGVILILGSSPLRPQCVYELSFLHGKICPRVTTDYAKCRVAEVLCRKAIRMLISKGAGSSSYPGSTKLFILVKAPPSFNEPLHFLPKRDFKHSKKVVPFGLRFKCQKQDHKIDPSSSDCICSSKDIPADDLIWFQCLHVIKGLASNSPNPEE